MRKLIFATLSAAALNLPIAAPAAVEVQGVPVQPAGYDPSRQVVCLYATHEGILIRRPICQSAQAWLSRKEHDRQEFRDQLRLNLTRNQ